MAGRGWTAWALSGELPPASVRRASLVLAVLGAIFTVGTYHVLFGAVVSPLHPRVSYHNHHISLTNIALSADAAIAMDAFVDAGPDTGAAYIIAARLVAPDGSTAPRWDGETLAGLAPTDIVNAYPYVWASHFKTQKIGFSGKTGGKARLSCRHRTPAQRWRRAPMSSCWKPSMETNGARRSRFPAEFGVSFPTLQRRCDRCP